MSETDGLETSTTRSRGLPLEALVRYASECPTVRRDELAAGDRVVVSTRNSIYSIESLGEDRFNVSGGWFAHRHRGPVEMPISGCTFGGRAIKQDIVAAPGLFLEFGNGVVTTRIRSVRVLAGAP